MTLTTPTAKNSSARSSRSSSSSWALSSAKRAQRDDGSRESVSRRKCLERRRDHLAVRVAVQSSEIGTERRTETESEHAVFVPLPRDDHRGTGRVDPEATTGVSMILDLRSSFGFCTFRCCSRRFWKETCKKASSSAATQRDALVLR